ncbi:hypothetical protein BGZ95_000084 [Linnemannia exigua]|uniref:Uncharacterized protein n=1 Tax=Linnemannia exigua TaxID=604196 RepID=A0AAD4D8S2_9FUNG|nr:hypothetical protein BGZ95_000084 [Linnemannia exigua]
MKSTFIILAALSITAITTVIAHPRPEGQDAIGRRVDAPVPGAVVAAPMYMPTVAPKDMKRRADSIETKAHTNNGLEKRAETTGTKSNADTVPQKRAVATKTDPSAAKMQDLFMERAWMIRDLTIQGRDGLGMLSSVVDETNQEIEWGSRFFRHGPYQPPRYLFQNQLTRLAFEEWGPPVVMHEIAWTNFKIAEELLWRNRDSLRSVEFSLRLKTQPWGDFDHIHLKTSQTIAAMRNLTSLVLKGPSVELSVSTLFKLLVNCPAQLEVLKVEHTIQSIIPSTWNHLRQWDLGPALWGATSTPLSENACNWNELTCNCRVHLNEIWSQTLPTQIRVFALPSISNTELVRPILIPFLKYRCPRLASLKIKTLGSLPLAKLQSTLNADAFPDLQHLELDGIRKSQGKGQSNMFPVYDLALNACTTLESLTVSADSNLVEEVPALVEMVLKKHARTLKAVRWLGFGGKAHERLDLQWFLNACPSLERVEITSDHRFSPCTFQQTQYLVRSRLQIITAIVTVTDIIIDTATILSQSIRNPISTQSSNIFVGIILGLCIDSDVPRD